MNKDTEDLLYKIKNFERSVFEISRVLLGYPEKNNGSVISLREIKKFERSK